jgi:lipopolysaccharide biosynthesis regulator YciM
MELLFLLLPVAAMSGWLLAKRHYRTESKVTNSTTINPDYFKGLNFLLNEQPDKAIDVFISLLEVNTETVETHLALANLFRRRGETDRAIRIHQNLIARPTLSAHQRDLALNELGLDYMHAGVLDRAESLFLDLIQKPTPPNEAYRQLVRIYQQEKKWQDAIDMALKLQTQSKQNLGPTIAQFYCELAEESTLKASSPNENQLIRKALSYDPDCVRATLLDAQYQIKKKEYRKAIKSLFHIENQDISYLSEAMPLLLQCHQELNELSSLHVWLNKLLSRTPNLTTARLMNAHVIESIHGSQAAHDYLYNELQHHPSVEGIHTLLVIETKEPKPVLPLIQSITHTIIKKAHRYRCHGCGFSGKKLYWQCPSCKHWNVIKPTEVHLSSIESIWESTQ